MQLAHNSVKEIQGEAVGGVLYAVALVCRRLGGSMEGVDGGGDSVEAARVLAATIFRAVTLSFLFQFCGHRSGRKMQER